MKTLLIYLTLLISTSLLADEPPDWQAFLIHSANNKWTAYIYPEKISEEPWKDKWHLQVFNKNLHEFPAADDKYNWTSELKPTGYPEGILSDDGVVFAQVSFWYQHNFPLVTIYRQECKQEHYANALMLPKNMPASASHQIWLDQKKTHHFIKTKNKLELEVFTLVGKRLISAECK